MTIKSFEVQGNIQTPTVTSAEITNFTEVAITAVHDTIHAWYNIFGEINNTTSTTWTSNGSVTYDATGNIYVLGSTTDEADNFNGNNLFLKYSPTGALLWRKTWTDANGMNCGSFNASMRFQPATTATIDTILWASYELDDVSYIGTMELSGNLVDLTGQARAPKRITNYRITDIIPVHNFINSDSAYISGQHIDSTSSTFYLPSIGGVTLDDSMPAIQWAFLPGDLNVNSSYNHFKSVDMVSTGSNLALYGVGNYVSIVTDNTNAIVGMLTQAGPEPIPQLYRIGANYSTNGIWAEDCCSDSAGNTYIIVNNNDSGTGNLGYTVIASTDLFGTVDINRWQKKISWAGTIEGTGLVYHAGYVYASAIINSVVGQDLALIKLDAATGEVAWSRIISSPAYDGFWWTGVSGMNSSSDISIDPTGTYIAFNSSTQDNIANQPSNFTIQYPLDGALLGTFDSFMIADASTAFTVGNHDYTLIDITTSTTISYPTLDISTATLIATTVTVGTRWNNFLQPLSINSSTWAFSADGALTLPPAGNITQAGYTLGPYTVLDGNYSGGANAEVYIDLDDNTRLGSIVQPGDLLGNGADPSSTTPIVSITNNGQGQWTVVAAHSWLSSNPQSLIFSRGDHTWTFGSTGDLTLPNYLLTAASISTSPQVGQLPGSITERGKLILTPPDVTTSTQNLVVYSTAVPTEGTHLHLASSNLDVTDIFLGNDNKFVKVGADGNVCIGTNTATNIWQFGTNGGITFPNNKIYTTNDLSIKVTNGIPTGSVTKIGGNQGWDGNNVGTNLPTTGGSGTGLTVDVIDGGSFYSIISINNPGSGYTDGDELTVTRPNVSDTFTISVPSPQWTFGTNGTLTLPGAITRVVVGTVAKTGVVLPTIFGPPTVLTGTMTGLGADNTYGPFTLGTVTFSVLVQGGGIAGFVNVTATGSYNVNDTIGQLDSGQLGGTPGSSTNIGVAGVAQETPTALDLTKSVNKLTTGRYTMADGVEGQIMYLVRQTGSVYNTITVNVANARVDGALYTTIDYYPFDSGTFPALNMSTLIFTDGAWQASSGSWD